MIVGQHKGSVPFMMRNCSSCERVYQPVVVGWTCSKRAFGSASNERQSDGEENRGMERIVCLLSMVVTSQLESDEM